MAITLPNLGLKVWNAPTDPYNSEQLAQNWYRMDEHDHSPGKGRQLPANALLDGAITTEKLSDGAVTLAKTAADFSASLRERGHAFIGFGETVASGTTYNDLAMASGSTIGMNTNFVTYTAATTGLWLITARLVFPANATGYRSLRAVCGATTYDDEVLGNATTPAYLSISMLTRMVAGDVFRFQSRQNSGTGLAVTGSARALYLGAMSF
jgi:hypothetical protein